MIRYECNAPCTSSPALDFVLQPAYPMMLPTAGSQHAYVTQPAAFQYQSPVGTCACKSAEFRSAVNGSSTFISWLFVSSQNTS